MRNLLQSHWLVIIALLFGSSLLGCNNDVTHDSHVRTPDSQVPAKSATSQTDPGDSLDINAARNALLLLLQNPPDPRLSQALPVLQSPAASQPGWGVEVASEGWQIRLDSKTWMLIFWTSERGVALECSGKFIKDQNKPWVAEVIEIRRFSQLP